MEKREKKQETESWFCLYSHSIWSHHYTCTYLSQQAKRGGSSAKYSTLVTVQTSRQRFLSGSDLKRTMFSKSWRNSHNAAAISTRQQSTLRHSCCGAAAVNSVVQCHFFFFFFFFCAYLTQLSVCVAAGFCLARGLMFHGCFAWLTAAVPAPLCKHWQQRWPASNSRLKHS